MLVRQLQLPNDFFKCTNCLKRSRTLPWRMCLAYILVEPYFWMVSETSQIHIGWSTVTRTGSAKVLTEDTKQACPLMPNNCPRCLLYALIIQGKKGERIKPTTEWEHLSDNWSWMCSKPSTIPENFMMQAADDLNGRVIWNNSLNHSALSNYTSRMLPARGLHLYTLFLIKLKLLKPNYALVLFYTK